MSTPIDVLLGTVDWTSSPPRTHDEGDGLYATHFGELKLLGHTLKCYRLNDGQAVFDADDFRAMFAEVL